MFHRNIPFRNPQKPRKVVKCKGRLPGTIILCGAELCQTDGEVLYVTFGRRDIAKQAKKSDNPFLVCPKCGYETCREKVILKNR